MGKAILDENLRLLRQRWPGIAERVERAGPLPADAVSPSRAGAPTLRLAGESGNPTWIHSRYDPIREAEDQIARLGLEPVDSVFIFGFGLGYPLLAAVRRGHSTNLIVAVERDPAVFRAALENVDLGDFFRHREAILVVGVDSDRVFDSFDDQTSRVFCGSVKVFTHPATARAFPSYSKGLARSVDEFMRHGSVSIRSALYLSRISLRNRLDNLADYVTGVDLRSLEGRFRGRPGILVGAGPSLQQNVEDLRRARGRAVVIAVSTSLRMLLGRGIRPDLTAIIDYHAISRRYFEDIPSDVAPPIVCDAKANTEAIESYAGRRIFGNDYLLNSLMGDDARDRGDLTAGATVAHAAFNLLAALGCDPIILVGMDLSYPGGLHHVGGTAIQDQQFAETNRFYTFEMKEREWYLAHRRQLIRVPGVVEEEVWTSDVFLSYLRELEAMFAAGGRRVIDATEGGARKRHTDVMPLAEAIDRFATSPIPEDALDLVGPPAPESEDLATIEAALGAVEQRLDEAEELAAIYRRSIRSLEKIVKITSGGVAADEEVVKVIRAKEKLRRYGFLYFMLNQLAQSDLRQRINRDLDIQGGTYTGVERQRRQAERDLEYVKGLRGALEFLVDAMTTGRRRLRARAAALCGRKQSSVGAVSG